MIDFYISAYNNKGNRNSHERKKHGGVYPQPKYEPV